jgi:hypothetical protein
MLKKICLADSCELAWDQDGVTQLSDIYDCAEITDVSAYVCHRLS